MSNNWTRRDFVKVLGASVAGYCGAAKGQGQVGGQGVDKTRREGYGPQSCRGAQGQLVLKRKQERKRND